MKIKKTLNKVGSKHAGDTVDRTDIVKYLQHKAEFEEEDCVAASSRAGLSWNLAFELILPGLELERQLLSLMGNRMHLLFSHEEISLLKERKRIKIRFG